MEINIISHYYVPNEIKEHSDVMNGTTVLYRNFQKKLYKNVLFCGVLYMAEDIYALSGGESNIYLPEIEIDGERIVNPRCPMEMQIDQKKVEKKRSSYDYILSYVNTSSKIKVICDGVYNGTEAIKIINKINSKNNKKIKIGLVGDSNVNWWIKQEAKKNRWNLIVENLTPSVCCPPHNSITLKKLNELIKNNSDKDQKYDIQLHSETNRKVIKIGMCYVPE